MKKILALVVIVLIGVGVWKFLENKETTIQGPETTPAGQEVGQAVGETKAAAEARATAEAKAVEDAKKGTECMKAAGSDQAEMAKCAELFSPVVGSPAPVQRSKTGESPTLNGSAANTR
jgi:hypothetical protein